MQQKIDAIRSQCISDIEQCTNLQQLQNVRVKYLGKSGELTLLLKGIKDVASEMRPVVGNMVNELRRVLTQAIDCAEHNLATKALQQQLDKEKLDISLTECPQWGTMHPVTLVENEICNLLGELGFEVVKGPEIEREYYNFTALNIPEDHPSRDLQDTFYINTEFLLRTQTSAMQARHMEQHKPPIKMVCPGKVFRPDSDASHSPVFHQIEGLVVDTHITLCDLKGTLEYLAQNLFDKNTQVRFRPSYFPFTEPSVEVDLTCSNCHGKGCSLCKGTGWIEVLGAGMVNPYVLEKVGIDSNKYTGFAFGMGVERIAIIKYGIPDIRMFYENDVRFLKQFTK